MELKICANTLCNSAFESKNAKKKFCSIRCKNQAAYMYNQKHYAWEAKMKKSRWKNIQILEYLLMQGHSKISLEQLKIMGFDFTAAHIPHKDENNFQVFQYGNIGMRIVSKTDCELFNIKTK